MCIEATVSSVYIYLLLPKNTVRGSFDILLPIVPSVEDVAGIVSLESGGVYIDAFKRSVSMSSCNIRVLNDEIDMVYAQHSYILRVTSHLSVVFIFIFTFIDA